MRVQIDGVDYVRADSVNVSDSAVIHVLFGMYYGVVTDEQIKEMAHEVYVDVTDEKPRYGKGTTIADIIRMATEGE